MKFGIRRWEPFRDMVTLREDIDSLFNDFFQRTPVEKFPKEGLWFPALDIEETKETIVINAEIPGLKKEDIQLSISEGQLVLQGERRFEKEEKEKTYHRIERQYGSFKRTISLPTEVEADKTQATYKNGILNIVIPKSKKAKPKEIGIDVK
jgi:HSP20 family protein